MFSFLAIILFIFVYFYGTRNHKYWEKKGVKCPQPVPIFGNFFWQFFQKISLTDAFSEFYWRFPDEKFVGLYISNVPALVIRDPQLIKHVLVTDFDHFYPRGLNPHKYVIEPMLKNLFHADGDLWKLLRQRMTPAFTTRKLKSMFPLIVDRANRLRSVTAKAVKENREVDVREIMARYTTDFIGACGFGIDSDALNDEKSIFRKLGKDIFTPTKRDGLMSALKRIMPDLFKDLHFLKPTIQPTTLMLVKNIMAQRGNKPSGRNDFIDLLLELKEHGKILGESIENKNKDGTPKLAELEFDDKLMAAQVFVFFAAGFETSSSATSFTLHQLAFHPDIQAKCQAEIDEVLARYDGQLCYESVKEMKYLEMTFKEGMRMFPSLGFLMRKCARPYTLPETDVRIDEGVTIAVPLQALHNDEKYFDSPEQFRPERFMPYVVGDIESHVYLPFGEGPRACIGKFLQEFPKKSV